MTTPLNRHQKIDLTNPNSNSAMKNLSKKKLFKKLNKNFANKINKFLRAKDDLSGRKDSLSKHNDGKTVFTYQPNSNNYNINLKSYATSFNNR